MIIQTKFTQQKFLFQQFHSGCVTAVISLLVTFLAIYLLCKHKKLRMLVTSLALQQRKEVSAVTTQEDVNVACTCKIQFYIILALSISIFGLVIFAVLHYRKLKLCKGCLSSNAVKIMLFISDVQYYAPIKLCKIAVSTHLLKITGKPKPENVKLKWNYILGYNRNRLEGGQCDIQW